MSKNALNVIDVIAHVDAAASYNLSPQDKTVLVTNIPRGGTLVFLPQEAQSGDRYQVTADASCGPLNLLSVRATLPTVFAGPPFIGGATFGGIAKTYFQPEASVELFFEENTQSWWVDSQSSATPQQILAESFTPIPATLVLTGAPQIVVSKAIVVPPLGEAGEFFLANFPVDNSGGAVAAGSVNAELFVDGVAVAQFDANYPFGVAGLTTVTLSGKLNLAPGAHVLDIRCTATAAGLEVVSQTGGLYIEQLGI